MAQDRTEPEALEQRPGDEATRAPEAPATVVVRRVHLAPLWRRLAAGAIDMAIVCALAGVHLALAVARLPDDVGPARGLSFDYLIDALVVYHRATVPSAAVLLILLAIYQALFPLVVGQTPGQMALGIEVVPCRTIRLHPLRALARGLCAALGLVLCGLGWSWVFLDRYRRAWHDLAGATVVGRYCDLASPLSGAAPGEAPTIERGTRP